MNHPLTDAYFTGPCEIFPNNKHRAFCRQMESGLRAEIERLQAKLAKCRETIARTADWFEMGGSTVISDNLRMLLLETQTFPSRECGQENRPGDVGVCRPSESPGVVPAGKDG